MSAWMASQIGVSKSHMSHMLAGRKTLSEFDARIVAAILGGDFFVLFQCPPDHQMRAIEATNEQEEAIPA